jgi:peptidoglycan hydrolase CwlO-like protein
MELVQIMVLSVVGGFLGWINHELGKCEEKIQTNKRSIEKLEVKLDFLKESIENLDERMNKLEQKIDMIVNNCTLMRKN